MCDSGISSTFHTEENPSLSSVRPVSPGVIDRWELLQAQALSKELRMKQNPQRRQQFDSDLNSLLAWLRETEEELEQLQRLQLSTDIQSIALQIQKLKVAALGLSRRCQTQSCHGECGSEETASPRCSAATGVWTRTLPLPSSHSRGLVGGLGRPERWTPLQNQPCENNHDLKNWHLRKCHENVETDESVMKRPGTSRTYLTSFKGNTDASRSCRFPARAGEK